MCLPAILRKQSMDKNGTLPALTSGKILVSLIGLFTAVSPYLADWNVTHIYNPAWPAHAKFHNAQTMVLGAFLGALSLVCLWARRGISRQQRLNEATVLAAMYWLAQLPAILFPGTALVDAGPVHVEMPVILGVEFNQLTMVLTFILPILLTGYFLESRAIRKYAAIPS